MQTRQLTIPIFGLTCGGGGALTLEQALSELPGVVEVYVNPATETAYITCSPESPKPEQVTTTIRSLGLRMGAQIWT